MALYKNNQQEHPFHPPIVLLALALYAITPVAFLASYIAQNIFLFKFGVITTIVGLFMALVVTLPGFVDLSGPAGKNPVREPSLANVIVHMLLSVAAVVVFMANTVYTLPEWNAAPTQALLPFFITLAGLTLKLGAVYFGWKIRGYQVRGIEVPLEGGVAVNADFTPRVRRTA